MKNFYGFLTKKGKNIFLITLLSSALLFPSCINDLFNDDKSPKKQEAQTEQTGSEELIPVKINISNKKQIENILQNVKPQKNISQARAASPQNVALKYKILYKKVTDTSQSSCELTDSSTVLQLSKGTWDFTLIAYYNDTSDKEMVVFSGDILNKEITPGNNNSLEFTLGEIEGNGSIKITLVIPKSDEYTTTVQAQLKTSSLQSIYSYPERTLTIQGEDSDTASYVYSIDDVKNGNYFAVFSITTKNLTAASDENSTETTTYPVPVRVVTNLTSESEETLTKIRNVCVITYDLGTDGTVSWTAAPDRVYTKYQNVTLPTYEKLAPIETKIFNGWKVQGSTDSESKTTMIIEQNVTLTPDWITTTLYVDSSATSTESDALATTTAVNTLSAAVNKLVTYENLDGDDASYQHDWTINVNGTCYGASDLSSLKITKLKITGDNNAQDILDGRTSETGTATGAVITKAPQNEGTYPLFIEYLTIQNGNNTSDNGGGLNITNSTAYLNNVILTGNTASDNGGAIALTNSKLFIYGGTIIGKSTSTVAESTNCSNKAGVSGGGIYADENSTIYFGYTAADEDAGTMTAEEGTPANAITYNYAGSTSGGTSGNSYGGGGIYCLGKLYTWGGTISYNSAAYGGGIYSTNLSMKGSTVSNNAATVEGGGIYKKDNTTKAVITSAGPTSYTKIIGNTSGNTSDNTSSFYGGGISFWGELYISDTIISGNKANGKYGQGGGIYVNSGTSSKLFLYGETTIGATSANKCAESDSASSNSAAAGGGIYLCTSASAFLNYSSENATAHTGTVNITYNYVQTDFGNQGGGGIFADSSSKLYIAPGTTINYNATNMNGGGIFGKGTTYMSGGTIYGNNASSWGGGIYLSGENYSYGTLYMYGEAKIGTSENLIEDSYSNSAVYGGGIYIDILSQAYLGIDEEKNLSGGVSYNKAFAPGYGGLGGGIYNKGSLQVSSGSISNNISESDGGGVYNKGDFQFSSGTISNNISKSDGGGVYNLTDAEFSMTGGAIESNTAVDGGGVYNKGIFNVSKGNIKSNTVTENGGGIYTTVETVLENSKITKNTAKTGGGVYISEDNLYIKKETTFNENTATNSGGAVYAYYTTIYIEGYIEGQEESAYSYIEPDSDCNDIYLDTYSSINIDEELSYPYYYVARITPYSYTVNKQYIYGEERSSYYNKFLVTPQSVNNTQVLWETTSEGKIKESDTTFVKIPAPTTAITGPVGDSGVFIADRELYLNSYYICDHEVTQGEYEKYCTYGWSPGTTTEAWDTWTQNETTKVVKDDNYPACFVSWYDALVYCNLRSIAEGLDPVYYFEGTPPSTHPKDWDGVSWEEKDGITKYHGPSPEDTVDPWSEIKQDLDKSGWRLPLEAEWEYAARGANGADGTLAIETYLYSGSNDSTVVAWMGNNAKIGTYSYPHEVKKLASNRLGLYDMSGNVVELCWDWYSDDLSTAPITGPESNTNLKVAAPGGAYQWPRTLKAYKDGEDPLGRSSNPKNARFCNAGFRIVRTIPE